MSGERRCRRAAGEWWDVKLWATRRLFGWLVHPGLSSWEQFVARRVCYSGKNYVAMLAIIQMSRSRRAETLKTPRLEVEALA